MKKERWWFYSDHEDFHAIQSKLLLTSVLESNALWRVTRRTFLVTCGSCDGFKVCMPKLTESRETSHDDILHRQSVKKEATKFVNRYKPFVLLSNAVGRSQDVSRVNQRASAELAAVISKRNLQINDCRHLNENRVIYTIFSKYKNTYDSWPWVPDGVGSADNAFLFVDTQSFERPSATAGLSKSLVSRRT